MPKKNFGTNEKKVELRPNKATSILVLNTHFTNIYNVSRKNTKHAICTTAIFKTIPSFINIAMHAIVDTRDTIIFFLCEFKYFF